MGGRRSWQSTAAWRACRVPVGRLGAAGKGTSTRGGGQGGASGRRDVPGGKTGGSRQTDGEGSGAPVLNRERSREEEEEGWFGDFPKIPGAKL